MNLQEYQSKEGFTPRRPSCVYCAEPRFYQDLCIFHTEALLVKLKDEDLITDRDVRWFIRVMLHESEIEHDITAINEAIGVLKPHHSATVIASMLSVSERYVEGALT